jgi:hypothetical protein
VREFYANSDFAEIVISFVADCPKQVQSFAARDAGPASDFAPDF